LTFNTNCPPFQVTVTLANDHNYLIFKKQNPFADVLDKEVDICQIHDFMSGIVDDYAKVKKHMKTKHESSICGVIVRTDNGTF
jgi:hypothetical protein